MVHEIIIDKSVSPMQAIFSGPGNNNCALPTAYTVESGQQVITTSCCLGAHAQLGLSDGCACTSRG